MHYVIIDEQERGWNLMKVLHIVSTCHQKLLLSVVCSALIFECCAESLHDKTTCCSVRASQCQYNLSRYVETATVNYSHSNAQICLLTVSPISSAITTCALLCSFILCWGHKSTCKIKVVITRKRSDFVKRKCDRKVRSKRIMIHAESKEWIQVYWFSYLSFWDEQTYPNKKWSTSGAFGDSDCTLCVFKTVSSVLSLGLCRWYLLCEMRPTGEVK